MDNYETLLSGGEEDFDFSTLLADDETQQTSFDNNQHQQQQIPTVIDPNAIYAVPSDMSTFDFYNPMSDNQNPSVTFQTTAPIIPVMFNNNYAPAMLQNMHPSMFSNAFFGAFNTSPTQFMTGSVSSNSLSPIGTQTTTDQSSTSGQSSGASTTKKKTPARKKKKTSSDSKSTKQTSSGSENEEEKMRKKAAANGKKRDAEEIDADMKRLMTLENAEDLTEQQKEEKKKLRNRYTAKVSRDRKKKELETLRDENHGLQKKLDEASVTIKTLKDQNEKLVQQNQYLQSQLAVVYSSYSMSAANNPDNRKGNTIMRSAVILLGIVLVFTVFTFLTGSFSYNSSAKTSSFTPSSPQPEQKTARRLARGLLSINGSNSDHAPNYGSRSATPPPPVESVGSKTLPTQSSPHSHSVNQHLPEPIYVENTMEMGESLEEDFNTDGMMSYDVFYPSKLKRHFSSFSYQNPKQNASEAAHIRNYDNSTSASPVPKKKKSVTSQRHNNSKQISVLTKPTMLSKRIEEKKHKYERATVYVPSESNIPSDKSELHMFCPYLYPLVAGVPDTGYEFSTKDFETSKKSSMKIHIPIQMVCNKTNAKVIRMAEINAENITLSDVFYEFNGPSLPPRSVVTN